jgi:hypothetical protein
MRGAAKRRTRDRAVAKPKRAVAKTDRYLSFDSAAGMALACILVSAPAGAADVLASSPSDLMVTVYRAPDRGSGSINLDRLGGFALISETRTVRLPAGVNRLRFEGVADGIEPASAIVTGFDEGVLEKNREGKLLSPASLLAAAEGKPVTLLRADKKTGESIRTSGTLRSDAEGGVVFETAQGIEALRCSGLAESFSFDGIAELSATPTLSLLVRSSKPVTRTVTLSYLARGFDWAADYIATVSADEKTMDLGAWVTLANANGVGFPSAHTQVVAGRVNRESGEVQPLDPGGPILALCWPRGSTSDPPQYMQIDLATPLGTARDGIAIAMTQAFRMAAPASVGANRVEQEQLGDLKLYRVPDRTTVASRQSKQVRLMDRLAIPITWVYSADMAADDSAASAPASLLLRTKNTRANHLGVSLPSGRVAVFAMRTGVKILRHESGIGDLAIDEEVELNMGDIPDVRVTLIKEKAAVNLGSIQPSPLGTAPRSVEVNDAHRVEISNARAREIQFELRLRLAAGAKVVRADHVLGTKNGRPIFRLTIPANDTVTLRYQTQRLRG